MLAPVRSAPLKFERFISDFAKFAPTSLASTEGKRLMSAAVKLARSRLARLKLARQPTALSKSAPERSASSKRVKLISAPMSCAPLNLERAKSVAVRRALLSTAPVRSSFDSMSCFLEQSVQSTFGLGLSSQPALADPVRATRRTRVAAKQQALAAPEQAAWAGILSSLCMGRSSSRVAHREQATPRRPERSTFGDSSGREKLITHVGRAPGGNRDPALSSQARFGRPRDHNCCGDARHNANPEQGRLRRANLRPLSPESSTAHPMN